MSNPNHALAGSNDFMHMFGHVCLGLMWARMGKVSSDTLAAGTDDAKFYGTKLATGPVSIWRASCLRRHCT